MGPIETLIEEHNAVKVLLNVLEVICGRLESNQKVDADHIRGAVHVIRNFADKAHHLKEEDLLFPVMENAGVSREKMLLEEITTEHDLGRGYVRGISDALLPYSIGDDRAGHVIRENAGKYVSLMTSHIGKEEETVFPLAESHLSQADMDRLAREFERVDRDVVGEEKHHEFERILSSLSAAYLERT
jgi:hemerythrin-like domain-containing protein